jgi:hypothetical protein
VGRDEVTAGEELLVSVEAEYCRFQSLEYGAYLLQAWGIGVGRSLRMVAIPSIDHLGLVGASNMLLTPAI